MSEKLKSKKVKKTKGSKLNISTSTTPKSKKNLIVVATASLAVIVIAAAVFVSLSTAFSTETYYILNQNVPAKQEITIDMVSAQETSKNTGPANAISMEEIQRGGLFAKYPLYAGDVIAHSNVGSMADTSSGIPDDWSVTSFTITSDSAVGGVLGRGDYVDLIGINDEGARYVFNNILILDATFNSQEIDEGDERVTIGEVIHYTVGMPAEDVAYLHSALHDYDNIKVVKAPASTNYNGRDTSSLDRTFKFGPNVTNKDLLEGSDPTFAPVVRDKNGVPVNVKTCELGQADKEKCIELDISVMEDDEMKESSKINEKLEQESVEETEDAVE